MKELFQAIVDNDLAKVRELTKSSDIQSQLWEPYHTSNVLISPTESLHDCEVTDWEGSEAPKFTEGPTALHEAVRLGRYDISQYLLSQDAKADAEVTIHLQGIRNVKTSLYAWKNISPFHFCQDKRTAILLSNHPSQLRFPIKAVIAILTNIIYRNWYIRSPLEKNDSHTSSKDLRELKIFLAQNLNQTAVEKHKVSLLLQASHDNIPEILEIVLKHSKVSTDIIIAALAKAISANAIASTQYLLEHGVDVNLPYNNQHLISLAPLNCNESYIIAKLLLEYGFHAFHSKVVEDIFCQLITSHLNLVININDIAGSIAILEKIINPDLQKRFFLEHPNPEVFRLRQIFREDARIRWVIPIEQAFIRYGIPTPIKETNFFLLVKAAMTNTFPYLKVNDLKIAIMKAIIIRVDDLKLTLNSDLISAEINKRKNLITFFSSSQSNKTPLPTALQTLLTNAELSLSYVEAEMMKLNQDNNIHYYADFKEAVSRHLKIIETATQPQNDYSGSSELTLKLAKFYCLKSNPLYQIAKARYLLDRASSVHNNIEARFLKGSSLYLGSEFYIDAQDISAGTVILQTLYKTLTQMKPTAESIQFLPKIEALASKHKLSPPGLLQERSHRLG